MPFMLDGPPPAVIMPEKPAIIRQNGIDYLPEDWAQILGMLVKRSPSALVAIAQGTGTAIGDMTAAGGVAAAFDGVTIQSEVASAGKIDDTVSYIGKDYGTARQVRGFEAWGSSGKGFSYNTEPTITLTLVGHSSNAPASGTTYKSVNGTDANGLLLQKLDDLSATASWRYWWIKIEQNGGVNHMRCAEAVFYA